MSRGCGVFEVAQAAQGVGGALGDRGISAEDIWNDDKLTVTWMNSVHVRKGTDEVYDN